MTLRKEVGLVIAGLIVGCLIGSTLSGSRLSGRLSACEDMTSVINESLPLELHCEVYRREVYIVSPLQPGVRVSLDGKDIIR